VCVRVRVRVRVCVVSVIARLHNEDVPLTV